MDTNYTEGILELEATSRHFCWVPGQEPKIDWSNWEQSGTEEGKEEGEKVDSKTTKKTDDDANADDDDDDDASTDLISNVALWKTLDTALGDPKLISVEATVPATINSGLGILECAYAVDQDNNVIGFAYGTKPSDLIDDDKDEDKKADDGDDDASKTIESNNDDEKGKKGAENDTTVEENTIEDKMMVALNIRLLASRTENFTLAASYTHRIEKSKGATGNESENKKKNSIALESHLYKSKPFVLADIPKLPTPLAPVQESSDSTNAGAASPQVSP